VEAVKYQILIILLIAVGTDFGVISAIWLTGRHLFDQRHRLRLSENALFPHICVIFRKSMLAISNIWLCLIS
jgi:putative ABC transport system permease protein